MAKRRARTMLNNLLTDGTAGLLRRGDNAGG